MKTWKLSYWLRSDCAEHAATVSAPTIEDAYDRLAEQVDWSDVYRVEGVPAE